MFEDETHVTRRFDKILLTLKTEGFIDLAKHIENEYKSEMRLSFMEEIHVSSWRCFEDSRALLRALSFVRLQIAKHDNPEADKFLLRNIHEDVLKNWAGKYDRDREKVRIDVRENASRLREQLASKAHARTEAQKQREQEKSALARGRWRFAIQDARGKAREELIRKRPFDRVDREWLYPYFIFPHTPFRAEHVAALTDEMNGAFDGLGIFTLLRKLECLKTRFEWAIDSLQAAETFQDEIFEAMREEQRRQRELMARVLGGIIGAGLSLVLGPLGPAIGGGISSALGGVLGTTAETAARQLSTAVANTIKDVIDKRVEDAMNFVQEKTEAVCKTAVDKASSKAGEALAERMVADGPTGPVSLAQQVREIFDQQYEGIHDGITCGMIEICGAGPVAGELLRKAGEDKLAAAQAQQHKAIDYLWEMHSRTRKEIHDGLRKEGILGPLGSSPDTTHFSDGELLTVTRYYIRMLVRQLAARLKEDFKLGTIEEAPQAAREQNVGPLTHLWKVYLLALYVEDHHGLESDDFFSLPGPMFEKYRTDWFATSVKTASGSSEQKLKFVNRTSGTSRVTNVNDPVRLRAWLYYVKNHVKPCEAVLQPTNTVNPARQLADVKAAAEKINQFVEDKKAGRRGPKEKYPKIDSLLRFVRTI